MVEGQAPVNLELVKAASEALEVSERSIASKLRKLGIEVASMAQVKGPVFTADEAAVLAEFVEANSGQFTYAQIAEQVLGGAFTSKQVQGKLLSLELTAHVKPAERVEAARTYTPAEEATFLEMCTAGAFVEEIAAALGKTVNSVRGKALSFLRTGEIAGIPAQKESHAKAEADILANLSNIGTMSLADIVAATGKTERGIKVTLTRRGIDCTDYKGSEKKAKNEAKKLAE
jgi:hypothetical protein